jgi:prepilin signal peptidase PulO-like enzyme (type II secretory pathway)
LFDALKAHDVEILDAAKLAAKVGASAPWTGRAWLMVQAETAPELLKVQALVRSPTGILINLSTDAVD